MESPAITTLIKMMKSLPEAEQNQVLEAVRAYIADLQDETRWDESFRKTENRLGEAARLARKQIKEAGSDPFDLTKL